MLLALTINKASAFHQLYQGSNCIPKASCHPKKSQTSLDAYINIDENAPRDVATMDQWTSQYGVQKVGGFQLTSQDGSDINVMTTESIPSNTPILFVPNMLVLSARQCQDEFGKFDKAEKRLVSAKAAEHVPKFYLFVKILREFEMGDQSPWFPWLNSLPRYFANGASMTPFCFDCLPPLASHLAYSERIKFIQFFQALKYVDCLSEQVRTNKALCKWAFSAIYTRFTQTPDGDFKIAPMADMFNHASDPEAQLVFDQDGNCNVYTIRDVPPGSPLRISYGDTTNPSFLFARYGFLDETSNASFCKILIKKPSQRLKDMGYDHSRMLFYSDTGQVSQEVWDVLLYRLLESTDPNTQEQLYQAHMNGDHNTKQAIHQQYYPQTLQALQNHVGNFLNDLDRLESKVIGTDVAQHPRLPKIMEHNNFVKQTFWAVQQQLSQ